MKYKILLKMFVIAGFSLVLLTSSSAQDEVTPKQLFSKGNDYYVNGEYKKAIDEYEKIISMGYESGPLYYNIADTYFKSGEIGKAILNYKRATLIMPRDADLKANYRFARAMVKGKPIKGKGIWEWRPLKILAANFTINELTWLSSATFILILILLSLILVRPNTGRYLTAAAIICLMFIVLNILVIWKQAGDIRRGAVTVSPTAEAFFGPFDTATKFFTLYEGNPVNVLKAKDDWYKVRRADGKVGWVKKNDVERIYAKGKSSEY